MRNKLVVAMFVAVIAFALVSQQASAARYTTTQPIGVSPQYGYITTQGPGGDSTVDVGAVSKWFVSSDTFRFNGAGCNLSLDTCRNEIIQAAGRWKNVRAGLAPDFQYQSPDISAKPSMLNNVCGTGTSTTNGVNEVAFCNISGGQVRTSPSFYAHTVQPGHPSVTMCDDFSISGVCFMEEADMILGSGTTYTAASLEKLAMHEFGHWMPLGDLSSVTSNGFCTGTFADGLQSMCDQGDDVLSHGDKAGARFLYPKTFNYFLTANEVQGADIALGNFDGTSNQDMLVVWADFVSPTNRIKVRPLWNIIEPTSTDPPTHSSDPSGIGGVTTQGTVSTLFSLGSATTTDVGATLALVDNDSTLDLVVTYTDTEAHYRIYFDISRSVDGVTFTGGNTAEIDIPGTGGDDGTDVEVFDVTGDGQKDLLVLDSFSLALWYYVGKTLGTSGSVSQWFTGASSDSFFIDGEHLGSGTLDSSARIVNVLYKLDSAIYSRYQGLKFNTGDTAPIANSADSMQKVAPLDQTNLQGLVGVGSAAEDLDHSYGTQPVWNTYKEQFVARVEFSSATSNYRIIYNIDWQSRINSHG